MKLPVYSWTGCQSQGPTPPFIALADQRRGTSFHGASCHGSGSRGSPSTRSRCMSECSLMVGSGAHGWTWHEASSATLEFGSGFGKGQMPSAIGPWAERTVEVANEQGLGSPSALPPSRAERQHRIILTALEQLSESDYDAIQMRDVAEAADWPWPPSIGTFRPRSGSSRRRRPGDGRPIAASHSRHLGGGDAGVGTRAPDPRAGRPPYRRLVAALVHVPGDDREQRIPARRRLLGLKVVAPRSSTRG